MRLHRLLLLALLASPACAQIDDLRASYDFLVRDRAADGVLRNFPIGGSNYLLPGSYADTAAYWAVHVCQNDRAACAVTDTYNALTYELIPAPGPAGERQVERVNAHTGANIYDAAAWQIAVMLGAVKNGFPTGATSPYALASGLTQALRATQRAITTGNTFLYNGAVVGETTRAYAFRALTPDWLAPDPFMDTPYASWIAAKNLPSDNPAYRAGKITWTDWKPITGENAWAFLIGPLQAAHLQHGRSIPFDDPAVQNALDILPTFAVLQSPVGGVYYAPAGTIGNEGTAAVNPHQVSVENNLSLYAGLRLLQSTLRATQSGDRKRIDDALRLIAVMIDGGPRTKGLLAFFKAAWQDGIFVQGGLANDPAQARDWVPTAEPRAVDVQTWGIAALGTQQIDAWFGPGAAFALWQKTKAWGGYGVGATLWGVGYSDRDGNGVDPAGNYRQGVLSGEWTAGAIVAVRNMIRAYAAEPRTVASLKQDEAAMLKALTTLRLDRYAATDFPGKPADAAKLMSLKTQPYLYASRRYHIPFGWYANPLPSTASTAWVVMLANGYDPFGIGGAPN